MALLLPQCAPPEPLHLQLSATIRQRRLSTTSRRAGARATHGATESASTDHFRVPSSEPCCNLMSPLVMAPRKPVRRSSRLRVRKGRDEIKTDSEMDAAEWISRVLANNGVVEVDPVTMAEQMHHLNHHAKQPTSEYYSTNTHYYNESPNLTSSSEPSHDYYSPVSGNGSSRVPLGVALAAGSAVALAAVAILVQTLNNNNNRGRDGGTISSTGSSSRGNNGLTSGFTGEPVTPDQGSPHRTRDNKVPAEVLAGSLSAGAAAFQPGSVRTGRNSSVLPSPPSLSKSSGKSSGEKPRESQFSKYASVTPFFSSDRSQAVSSYSRPSPPAVSRWREDKYKSVPPFFPSDRLAAAAATVTVSPFFPDEQPGSGKKSETHGSSSKAVAPFFPDDQPGSEKKSEIHGSSSKAVTPFFPDDSHGKRTSYMESVTPFFADERGNKPSRDMEAVTPFFADERQRSRNGPSYLETVTPFFADEQGSQRRENGSDSYMQTVTPFFPDEQQGNRSATGVSRSKPGTIELENVEENVKPFFPVGTSTSRQSSGGSRPSVFWDGESSSGAQRDSSATSPAVVDDLTQSDGKQMLAEMAGKYQGQHKEFMEGTTEERFASNMSGPFSFQGDEKSAPSTQARELSPEELTLLAEIQAEEEKRYAKMQALQAAFPALAIGAGAVGALVGVDGAFEMVGLTATASFISYELLWANKRKELLDEMSRITDHHKLFSFLQKRKIVKDDC